MTSRVWIFLGKPKLVPSGRKEEIKASSYGHYSKNRQLGGDFEIRLVQCR